MNFRFFLAFLLLNLISFNIRADMGASLLASVAIHAGVLLIPLKASQPPPSSDLDAMAGLQPRAPVVNPPTASNPSGRINIDLTPNNPAHVGQQIRIKLQPDSILSDPPSESTPPVALPGDTLYCAKAVWGSTICGPTPETMSDGFVGTHATSLGNMTITKVSSNYYTYCFDNRIPQCPNYEQLRFNNVEVTITTDTTCPDGYKPEGALCVKELKDFNLDIELQDDIFLFRPSDPDLSSPDTFKPLIKDNGQTVQMSGRDPVTNLPKTITVSHDSATNNTTVRVDAQVNGSTGSQVDTTIATIGTSGDIASVSTSSQSGTLNNPTGPGSGDGTPAGEGSSPGSGSSITPGNGVVFPTDYARVGEADKAATKINKEMGEFRKDFAGVFSAVDAPEDGLESPEGDEIKDLFFKGTFDNLIAWRLPSHSSVCPKPTIELWGKSYAIESHCTLGNQHLPIISNFMMVLWVLLALFIVLRA